MLSVEWIVGVHCGTREYAFRVRSETRSIVTTSAYTQYLTCLLAATGCSTHYVIPTLHTRANRSGFLIQQPTEGSSGSDAAVLPALRCIGGDQHAYNQT